MTPLNSENIFPSNTNRNSDELNSIIELFTSLPENEDAVPQAFLNSTVDQVKASVDHNTVKSEALDRSLDSYSYVKPLLRELDRFKSQLGGSPNYHSTPTIDIEDSMNTLFSIPISAIKDWFRMTLRKRWQPEFFWESLARIFNVTRDNKLSQYEEAHIAIQRFGLLIANKERFFDILDFQQEERYIELSEITGLAWHPHSNGCGTEKLYINFVEQFLTEYFQDARSKGDDALLEYFKAFSGVCFEDRARTLEAYTVNHPLPSVAQIAIPEDWDTQQPVEKALMKEAEALYKELGTVPNPRQLHAHLEAKGIFDMEFATLSGGKAKPSDEQFHLWAVEQVNMCILSE